MKTNLKCSECLGTHDPEIHAATLRVRRWFRDRVKVWIGESEPESGQTTEARPDFVEAVRAVA